jgi:sugar diacid utilization regulator
MLNASRARRMADAIDVIVADMGIRRVIDVHNNRVTMVCSAVSRESGWTAPRSSLARQLRTELARVGNAALIGVSNDVPATAHIPTALREAEAALELATVAHRVVQFAEIPLRRLLLHFAAPELHRVLPAWTGALRDADQRAEGALVATLHAYADTDMNVLKAAQTLGVHPNTIYARLQRIQEISGLRATSFNALNDLLAVSDCMHRGPFEAPSSPA